MAAPFLYLRFTLGFAYFYPHSLEQRSYRLLQYFVCQNHGFGGTSYRFQTTPTERLPGYNYGLPGKGKSRKIRSAGLKWTSDVSGELLFGLHPVYLALKAKKRKSFYQLHVHEKCGKNSNQGNPMLNKIFHLASENEININFVSKIDLNRMSGNRPHQGVCLDAEELNCLLWNESFKPDWHSKDTPLWLFLHNIQDPMNFGAILRSSYFMGVDRVILPKSKRRLVGPWICPDIIPTGYIISTSCKLSPVVSKASSGVMEVIDLLELPQDATVNDICQWWKSNGGMILGTHTPTRTIDGDDSHCVALQDFTLSKPSLLILGNEATGLGDDVARLCDVRLHVESLQPGYHEEIDSLNVSVATGILLHWLQQVSRLELKSK